MKIRALIHSWMPWLGHGLGLLLMLVAVLALAYSFRHGLLAEARFPDQSDIWLILDRATVLFSVLTMAIAAYSALVGVFPGGWLRRLVSRRRRFDDPESAEIRERADVVVLPISRNASLQKVSTELLKPKRIVLIGTNLQWLEEARAQVPPGTGVSCERVLQDESNSGEMLRLGRSILQRLVVEEGVPRERIVCDVTGGTKPMSIGLFMAAEEAGVAAAYIQSEREPRSGEPTGVAKLRYITRPPGG